MRPCRGDWRAKAGAVGVLSKERHERGPEGGAWEEAYWTNSVELPDFPGSHLIPFVSNMKRAYLALKDRRREYG